MDIPDYLAKLRAKSPSQGGETLYEHTWHVVARFADQARLRSSIADLIASPRLWHRLYWACFLHDFGKAAGGFQRMLATDGKERYQYRHEVGSLAFLGWLFHDLRSDDYCWIVAAIVSHHKDAATINEQYKPGGPSIRAIAAELAAAPLEELWRWVDEYALMWQQQLGLAELGIEQPKLMAKEQAVALVREQGVAQIEQALKVYRRFVDDLSTLALRKQATVTLALRGMIITADHSASAHVGPPPTLPEADYNTIVDLLGWSHDGLYKHQRVSAMASGDALLIAPTGSGKTESALFWSFGAESRQLPRLFYALPFQASMNAMQIRLEQIFAGQVGLQHSRAVQALYRIYIEDGEEPRFATQRAKAQKNRTELNYFPVRVFSPYQMLKACYRLRGYESIISDFFGAAFIFDEIHAYEPKRLALILTLIGHLKQHYGARFFVMSATFPDLIKEALQQALGSYMEIKASPDLFQAFQRHRLHLLHGDMQDPDNLAHILKDAREGKSVLVCCNTVTRVQQMWNQIREKLEPEATVVLLHSRLNGRDRLERETLVRKACGVGSEERQPVVLVATQVVEVSLNIDLDTIYTDLAPLEALIQRFGRVNRSRRKDAEGQPVIAPVYVFREPILEKDMRPYDHRLLLGSLRLLNEQNGNIIDESAVSDWLNTIYSDYAGDYAQAWRAEYQEHTTQFAADVLRSLVAFNVDRNLEERFYAAFDSIDVLPSRFETEYFDFMRDGRFVDADSLLVSIAHWQYGMLAKKGKIRQGNYKADDPLERVTIATTTYDDELGLLFDA
jgi:CRISPR-associated endonuclease/helicase Cas3